MLLRIPQKQALSHPNAVDLTMDLFLSRIANTSEKQPITYLKPWISANPTDASEKVKICIVFLPFYSNLYDLREMM